MGLRKKTDSNQKVDVAFKTGTAPKHYQRLSAGTLEMHQQHDRDEVAELQAARGRVEADIAGQGPLRESLVEPGSPVVDESAAGQICEELLHAAKVMFA